VADTIEAAKLLDIDMNRLAGMRALVATHRLGMVDVLEPRQHSVSSVLLTIGPASSIAPQIPASC
jgi:hypothetical protein